MDTPTFDFRRLSIDERIQLAEDIWDSILEEELELANALSMSPANAAELLHGVDDADACPNDGFPRLVLDCCGTRYHS